MCTCAAADFALMKEHRQKWEAAVVEWKDLICKLTLDDFIAFMESGEVLSPPDLERQKELLAAEQAAINRRRGELLQQMVEFRPPAATKSAIYEWKENIESLNQQLRMFLLLCTVYSFIIVRVLSLTTGTRVHSVRNYTN